MPLRHDDTVRHVHAVDTVRHVDTVRVVAGTDATMRPVGGPRRPSVRFVGGAGTVTGSKFLLETARASVLFDCGMFQGHRELRLRNRAPLPFDPTRLDAVVLTHAHLDHCGMLPGLVRAGFARTVHATAGTAALARIVLADAARLQQEDANYANRVGSSRHRPARPLFDTDDAQRAYELIEPREHREWVEVADGVHVAFHRSGHILGSSWLEVRIDGAGTLAISGDLGRAAHPLLRPPEPLTTVDTLLIESTYGDREHPDDDPRAQLADVITRTAARGGSVVIPAFAVDRTEVLLVHLRALIDAGTIPDLPVHLDSPMASAALDVYRRAVAEGWDECRAAFAGHEEGSAAGGDPFDPRWLRCTSSVEESKQINEIRYPSVIIAASGMATGGRVLHHLAARLPDARNSVVLAGHQVAGSRGRALADGARELKVFGEFFDVRAEVVSIPGFSVHADRNELVDWVCAAPDPPHTAFVVHGEAASSLVLADALRHEAGCRAIVARDDEIALVTPRPTRSAADEAVTNTRRMR